MSASPRSVDFICLGRAAVDLYGLERGARLEDAQHFAKYLGGSSGNLAVGLARLGLKVAMLTRVGDEHMGRFVRGALAAEGVDVSAVRTDPRRLTGLVLLGIESAERFPHIFYRENCADMGLEPGDADAAPFAAAKALAITGTHLSTEAVRAASRRAIALARQHGLKVALDIDYRPVLWGLAGHGGGADREKGSAEVTRQMLAVLPDCDLVVGTEEEIRVAGGGASMLESIEAIRARTPATIVVKRGVAGCVVFEGPIPASVDQGLVVGGFPVEVLNVLGAGDAFLSGYLSGWIEGLPAAHCARRGNAAGAIVVTRHGCTPAMPTRAELEEFLGRAAPLPRPDDDARIGALHRAATARLLAGDLCVLAFDHRRQVEQIAAAAGADYARIADFKALVADAVLQVAAAQHPGARLGAIVDGRHGGKALARLNASGAWIGRPVELPSSRPLEFEAAGGIGLELLHWPRRHVVKCLVNYHPADPIELRLAQEERLAELAHATERLERELLVEVIASGPGRAIHAGTTPAVLKRFYHLGIRPAWWKLESQPAESWRAIADVIAANDPLCHGVLLLGLDASEEQVARSFDVAASSPVCRGFAIGRTIFGGPAREWFAGEIDDAAAVARVAAGYARMIEAWQRRRPAAAAA
ncbi:MAG TPA: 5-dehydro-2-deoxygluconokinase [Steroidobacteraceae bacterium]|nr:5-dehydro-2-deoxygluconokinase [Steroidobacteraceae bacterium]